MKKTVITAVVMMTMILLYACANSSVLTTENLVVVEEVNEELVEPAVSPINMQGYKKKPVGMGDEDGLPMYSSFAYMRSFDPNTGIAKFDFFEILRGSDAVDYLINCQGYCSLVAETKIDNLGEDDFIEINHSLELRQVDLKKVPVMLLHTANGCSITDAQGVETSFGDIVLLYNKDKAKLLFSFYYYITINEDTGEVMKVEQVRKS